MTKTRRPGKTIEEKKAQAEALHNSISDQVEQLRFIAAGVGRGLSAADAHRLLAEQGEGGGSLLLDGLGAPPRLVVLLAERDPGAAVREQ